MFVMAKRTESRTPATRAVSSKPPARVLARNGPMRAMPLVSVTAVLPVVNVPLAPVAGAEKVAVMPGTTFPMESFTVTARLTG